MFVDELEIFAKAGNGGDGVVRWRREKHRPNGGPAGGNGGRGGSVYMRAVRDLGLLSKYTGTKEFSADNGGAGLDNSKFGRDGEDLYINVPVGATVTDLKRNRVYTFDHVDDTEKILIGGSGGLGNEYFKSSTNRAPEESTKGKRGEEGHFKIDLSLIVDAGFIGLPNAGKSTLLNTLTNATARVGSYPFTTLEPHLGDLHGLILADIPGLIEGAGAGKGLGHKFLRHVQKTKMLLHCVSLESEDIEHTYESIRTELGNFDPDLLKKDEWILLTKTDLVSEEVTQQALTLLKGRSQNIYAISAENGEGVKELSDALTQYLTKNEQKNA